MVWIDVNTALLKDKSILIFDEDGGVEFYGEDGWKKSATREYKFDNKQSAIEIWTEVEKLII